MRIALLLACAFLVGCAAPVAEHQADRLGQVYVGMSVAEFKQIFPKAFAGGQKQGIVAYVLRDTQLDWWSGVKTDHLVFYFSNDRLTQWGRPGDFRPDIDMTIRHR